MTSYTQLTREQRYQIKALLRMDHTQTEIARVLGVNKSTICRELQRNRGRRGYRPKQAHECTMQRRQHKAKPTIMAETWQLIEEKLRLDWSPEQIAGWLKKHNQQGYWISPPRTWLTPGRKPCSSCSAWRSTCWFSPSFRLTRFLCGMACVGMSGQRWASPCFPSHFTSWLSGPA